MPREDVVPNPWKPIGILINRDGVQGQAPLAHAGGNQGREQKCKAQEGREMQG